MDKLLAVDIGLKIGLALYGVNGKLIWYRSKNFGSPKSLKAGAYSLLSSIPDLVWLVLEGGGPLSEVWKREAKRRGVKIRYIYAEEWRTKLLYPREQRSGKEAKKRAVEMAKRMIAWSGARRPTSLRHDTAEAILIGLWGSIDIGWLEQIPPEVRKI